MDQNGEPALNRRGSGRTLLLVLLGISIAIGALALPGCSGCMETPQERAARLKKEEKERAEAERKKKEKKPDFEMTEPLTLPRVAAQNDTGSAYKPGHWTTMQVEARANQFDFPGELEIVTTSGRRPAQLVATPFDLASQRPAPLAKGTAKALESVVYIPPVKQLTATSVRLQRRDSDQTVLETGRVLRRMPSYQYYLIVLARWPERYQYLNGLDAVTPAANFYSGVIQEPFYRIVLPPSDRTPPLPSRSLEWTSIACLIWDDASPERFLPDQQQALVDWLHWGGQLVVSGPDSLDSLPASFLGEYLPATPQGTRELVQADFEEFNAHWTVPSSRTPSPPLQVVKPIQGVTLALAPDARFVPGCGSLVAERRVGRGRVVVTSFRLTGGQWTGWGGLDGFVNALVLGRPARQFRLDAEEQLQVHWIGEDTATFDPRVTTHLRYFSRDYGVLLPQYAPDLSESNYDPVTFAPPPAPGVAAWNDFSPVAQAARRALEDTARIEIPRRDFVVWVVAGYLLVLVPLNWMIFRVINRVEWAWIAAPAISIAATVLVIHLAQLDIGFVRARSDVAVLEIQGEHPRCHVTRYSALYSSLATPYQIGSAERDLQVLPFPKVHDPDDFEMPFGKSSTTLVYRHLTAEGTELDGFRAESSRTEFLHSEQMLAPGGKGAALSLVQSDGGPTVVNRLPSAVRDAGVVRRRDDGTLETAWIGTLEPGATAGLRFHAYLERPADAANSGWLNATLWPVERKAALDRGLFSALSPHLGQLLATAEDPKDLLPGDVRLVGWLDTALPGMEITPAASQQQHFTLVLAHLAYGFGRAPARDANLKEDITGPMADWLRRSDPAVPQLPTP